MAESKQETKAVTKANPNTAAPKRNRKRTTVESTVAAVWKPEKIGDCLEGTYLGSEVVPAKGKRDPFTSYHIRTDPSESEPNGKRYRVASAMLNSKMSQIPKGAYLWITYKGPFETDNGTSHDYDVEIEEGVDLLDVLDGQPASE